MIIIGVFKLKGRKRQIFYDLDKTLQELPYVSILIPAKDEEKNIGNCLDSILKQQYPLDRLEIVVVNDRSTDNTQFIIQTYMEKYKNIISINIKEIGTRLTGKQNAINEGLKYCSGDLILNTDADCLASSLWVYNVVSYFKPDVGFVAGFSIISNTEERESFFAKLQSMDMLFLMDAASGAIGLGLPVSCLGMNMAFRKELLQDVSYASIGYTVTEDAALIQKVTKDSQWKISAIYERNAAVFTYAVNSWKDFIKQRIRWTMGGRIISPWMQVILYSLFIFHLLILASLPLMLIYHDIIPVVLLSIFIKVLMDFVRCFHVFKEFGKGYLIYSFIFYEAFLIIYSVLISFGSLFIKKLSWKGEVYEKKNINFRDS